MGRFLMARAKVRKEEEQLIPAPVSAPSEDLWLSHGLDLQNRIVELTGVIAEPMASFVLRALIKLNSMNHDPITIYLNSAGGTLPDGLAIYDLIRACPSPVVIFATGKISSMAMVVLMAGDQRFAAKNTLFMMHAASHSTEGKIHETENDVKEVRRQDELTNKIVASRSKLKVKQLQAMMLKPDHYFNLTTAKKYGIITNNTTKRKKKR